MTQGRRKPRTIELEVRIDAPVEAVWKALTEASELSRWFPPLAEGKTGLGSELLFSWGPELQWQTSVVAWEPSKHLTWSDKSSPEFAGTTEAPAAPMAVDWTLETATGGQVVVRLVQSGFGEGEAWDDFYNGTDRGWRFYLFALRHYLQRHRGLKRDMVSIRRPANGGPEGLWKRVWGEEGFVPTPSISHLKAGGPLEVKLGPERLVGTVEVIEAPHIFWGRLASLEDATLLVEMEPGRERIHCGIWLSTYGLPSTRLKALQHSLTAMADRAFTGLA
jgi:uncharacterized protein YndB with AHSA1/START domain